MCGICGVVDTAVGLGAGDESVIRAMTDSLKHRGPDEDGFLFSESVMLGHRRLKVIDLDSGVQPISDETGTISVILNGEIYNYQELTEDLLEKGHVFKTATDTEVLVHLYEEYGSNMMSFLRGMFAFGIWDAAKKKLFLARDRCGQKPLFYSELNGRFYFSSELRGFRKINGFVREVDYAAVGDYLKYGYMPDPLTVYKGINKLLPGEYLEVSGGRVTKNKYWDIFVTDDNDLSFREHSERLVNALSESVSLRLRSDVPLGVFLSGGLDSAVIAMLAAKASKQKIKTFSVGFKDSRYDESRFARIASERLGTDHHEMTVDIDILESLPGVVEKLDQPFADSSFIPTLALSEFTRKHVTVALSGDGGDELFCGYDRYRAARLYENMRFLPAGIMKSIAQIFPSGQHSKSRRTRIKKFLTSFSNDSLTGAYQSWGSFFTPEMLKGLLKDEFAGHDRVLSYYEGHYNVDISSVLSRIMALDIKTYLPGDLLMKVDGASMAHSLEVRSPFMDHHVVEAAMHIPDKFKLCGGVSKYILKEIFKTDLPAEVTSRSKMGFGVPVPEWLAGKAKDMMRESLLSDNSFVADFCRKEELLRLMDEHIKGRRNHGHRLWSLMILNMWMRSNNH